MPHDPRDWDPYLPHPTVDYGAVAGTTVEVGAEADGQIVLTLRDGPALFVSFGRDEDPFAPGTKVEITLDWTRVEGPPATGVTPLIVAWTAGGGVLQLAPEVPDPAGTAPGARVLGGPEFVLCVPPSDAPVWIDRLLRLPRRFVLDRRPNHLVWLGGLDPAGRVQLSRLRRTEHQLLLDPAGAVDAAGLAPGSPLTDLAPGLRSRRAGGTRADGPAGRLSAELFAVESDRADDGSDQAAARLIDSMRGTGWTRDSTPWPPVWRHIGDGVTRWVALHENRSSCPVPLQVPELDGASCWVERGELLAAPSAPAAPPPARPRRLRRR